MMVHTDRLEQEIQSGTSYLDCFKGADLRRTEISCIAMGLQPICGLSLASNSVYFFEQAGFTAGQSFDLGLGNTALGFSGVLISWFLGNWFGRRSVFLTGLIVMTLLLLIIGFTSLAPSNNLAATQVQGALLVLWTFTFALSVGPLSYTIFGETSATRLRSKTIALSRNFYNVLNIAASVASP